MTHILSVRVPPTNDQGSARFNAASRATALQDYNDMRAHDGQPPLKRMPAGTLYMTVPTYYIQRADPVHGVETVDEFNGRKEALAMLAEYRMSDPTTHFYASTRACRNWHQ